MHLKTLTLRGFKSFASATTLEWEPGITCVVGPNGSGKSNIVDALTWVMGEQCCGVGSVRRVVVQRRSRAILDRDGFHATRRVRVVANVRSLPHGVPREAPTSVGA